MTLQKYPQTTDVDRLHLNRNLLCRTALRKWAAACFVCVIFFLIYDFARIESLKLPGSMQKYLKFDLLTGRKLEAFARSLYNVEPSFSKSQILPRIPRFRARNVSCAALFAGDKIAQNWTMQMMKTYKGDIRPDQFYSSINCADFLKERSYIMSEMSKEERDFPIAYSLVVFKELGQVERLFRSIYRPQNAYCFHVDKKSSPVFRKGIQRLSSCFRNVIVSSRSVDVKWGTWTVLEADLICMKELLQYFPTWKYLINLTGQEFPLRTNLELVRILKAFNGSNNMEGTVKRMNRGRAPSKYPGFNVTWTKGSIHIVAKRAFFEFVFTNKKAEKLAEMLKPMPIADETYFSTLNHNPSLGTPGAYLGVPETGPDYAFLPRYKNWGSFPCLSRKWVRQICIWGVLDLPQINKQPELFLNKLYWNFNPYALDCLEERIFNHTRRDYGDESATVDKPLVLSFYKNLSFVKNHQ